MLLKAAIELQPRLTAQRLYTTTFVRPPAIVIQTFGLLQLTVMEKTCSPSSGVDHALDCTSYIINVDFKMACGFVLCLTFFSKRVRVTCINGYYGVLLMCARKCVVLRQMGAVLADCCEFEQINQLLNQWGIIATVNSTMKLVSYCHNAYAVNIYHYKQFFKTTLQH